MSTLTGKTVADTYINLLQLNSNNQGVDATVRNIETGDGVSTALSLSTDLVEINGDIIPNDNNTRSIGSDSLGYKSLWLGSVELTQADAQELKSVRTDLNSTIGIPALNAVQRDENIDWSVIINTPTTIAGYGITDVATDTQGNLADNAVQRGENVNWSLISNTPTTLIGYGITDAATIAQGIKADTALQPGEAATFDQGSLADNSVQRNSDETINKLTLTDGLNITGGTIQGQSTLTIDPAAHGDATGKVVILGDLQVDGTTTTINSISVSTTDKQIILSQGSTSSADSDGSGVVVEGAGANLLYQSATDTWNFNKPLNELMLGTSGPNNAVYISTGNTGGFEGTIAYEPKDVPTTQTGEVVEFLTHFKSKYDRDAGNQILGTSRHIVAVEGGVCIGNTSISDYKLNITGNTYQSGSCVFDTIPNNDTLLSFKYNGVQVGSVSRNQTSTSFVTTSDYRLKDNLIPLTDAIERISQLPVYKFNFKSEPSVTVDGFVAHEVQDIVPEAVHGEKDQVDVDGNDIYQGIDQSKLVPLLVAAVKEQQATIDQLKARVESLESV